ncbi:MAG: polyribonucleotide nucleotidyltransferase [Methylacidiphilales bacterium]|nr:polyribonucleotide nucleotidyltransferase [Candidatus Methylacidiphilales bacterium]
MKKHSFSIQIGNRQAKIEIGEMARQATASALVNIDDTVVLATIVANHHVSSEQNFLPLSVHYQERAYAGGKIPGGYFRRESKPSEKEVLTSRLIDRPIRPLFPEGFYNEVQIICNVVSLNPEIDPDIVAMLASSVVCSISGLPISALLGAVRVGYIEGGFVVNPTRTELLKSKLDLVVAGTKDAILMVESQVKELSEKEMIEALLFAHSEINSFVRALESAISPVEIPLFSWNKSDEPQELCNAVESISMDKIVAAYALLDKQERQKKLAQLRLETVAAIQLQNFSFPVSNQQILTIISNLEYTYIRSKALTDKIRIDGRKLDEIRPISIRVGLLPRVHGSALFTRGETQALVATTLGTEHDAQSIDALEGQIKDRFLLHYNFPPFSTGEIGKMMGPGRREIGHGKLAKRALAAVMPDPDSCPYTVRVVSDILESNGSSSMATVCGATLSLLDAGVTITSPVAGIAMGLIKEGDSFAVLSDILGDEDHLGDMDFKVAGTEQGITALQMDIKINGITFEILSAALEQARKGRIHILNIMNSSISKPREDVSEYAPRFITIKINPDKIRDIIGKGGVTIRSITEETGVDINVEDNGTVHIASVDKIAGEEAKRRILAIASDLEVGKVYDGTVARIMEYGAFVSVVPGKDGLVHISQVSEERIENLNDVLKTGDKVKVKVLEIDKQGRVRLSMRDVTENP